jgi:hypothetical protein
LIEKQSAARDQSIMELGRLDAVVLFVVYAGTLVWSGYQLSGLLIGLPPQVPLTEVAIIKILCWSALSGASIAYARKLYKAGINNAYHFMPDAFTVSRISTIAYFAMRLPASVIIALVLYAIWRISLDFALKADFEASQSARYLFVVMGFFSGFSSGRFITYFENDGWKLANGGGGSSDKR